MIGLIILMVIVAGVVVTFGFWRVFRVNRRFRSSSSNRWKNENFAAMEATGAWAEDTLKDGGSSAPFEYPGQNVG